MELTCAVLVRLEPGLAAADRLLADEDSRRGDREREHRRQQEHPPDAPRLYQRPREVRAHHPAQRCGRPAQRLQRARGALHMAGTCLQDGQCDEETILELWQVHLR